MRRHEVTAISMVKDEIDVIERWTQHMFEVTGVDHLIITDNNSTDGTWDALKSLSTVYYITLLRDERLGYYQSARMTKMAEMARLMGADVVLPADADELFVSLDSCSVAEVLRSAPPNTSVIKIDMVNHFCDIAEDYSLHPFDRMPHTSKNALPKVAVRFRQGDVICQGNHDAVVGCGVRMDHPLLMINHYQWRSPQQFISKVVNGGRAYAATTLPEDMGSHWRKLYALWESGGDQALIDEFNERYVKD